MQEPPDSSRRPNLLARVWRSLFRGAVVPRSDRERKWVVLNTLVLHLRPTQVPASTLRLTHTFGLGGMSLVLVSLLMLTGVLMMFAYVPSTGSAYASIVALQDQVLFGRLVRGVHYWSANLLVLVALLHLARVMFTGGFHERRQFNWVIGCGLLLCLLASNFTGYLLPWDQLSYWAITICTGMLGYVPGVGAWLQQTVRGGEEVGQATLVIFYALHTTVLPALLLGLMAWHFWRVRKAGGVVRPPEPAGDHEPRPEKVLFIPHLLVREVALALSLVALVLVLALLREAPLGEVANPGMSLNPAKAPWYFLGFQELLLHFHPVVAVFLIPLGAALALALLPYLDHDPRQAGRWFLSPRGRRMGAVAALAGLLLTPALILIDERLMDAGGFWAGLPAWLGNGLLPLAGLLLLVAGFQWLLRRRFSATRNEGAQATFILLATALAVLTITGIWFRGKGMALVWPWEP